jgi:hypothetical protein
LCGLLSIFSPKAAQAAALLEAMGADGELGDATFSVEALTTLIDSLGARLESLEIEDLRRWSKRAQD